MTTIPSFFSIAFALTISIISISRFSLIEARNRGFSIDLIHRDSPESPFHNPSLTPSQRVTNALQRSFNRVHHFASFSPDSASTDVVSSGGEFLMKISIGTPPFEILAIADTGSDLIWTQCKPCTHCYNQKSPIFSPNNSSTYKELPCSSNSCQSLPKTTCQPTSKNCQYSVLYGDRSFSHGDLATEKLTLGSNAGQPVSFLDIAFGCGHNQDGKFSPGGSGIVGLGGGSVSLISQMGSSIGGKFSYCLVPMLAQSSKMNFGENGIVSGTGVVSTPIIPKSSNTFYYLTLEGISVGGKRLEFYNYTPSSNASNNFSQEGNIIIDSGTTLTILPLEFYQQLESEVKRRVELEPIQDPQHILSLCFLPKKEVDFPIITMHFKGADVNLNPVNTFVKTSAMSLCLAFAPATSFAIFGNLAQLNFLVGYDLQKKTVSFKPTDCTHQ